MVKLDFPIQFGLSFVFLLAFCFVRSLFAFRVPCLACLALVVGGGAFWGVGSALFCVVPSFFGM